ncbi:phospholipase D family protein [Phenylobacterium deserti]|uniref:Phospholipase n=1 Tax=Phenylobacterium deserti TaxID=1914756 RepID=A0A328A9E6_9CAUL|nr:phospholipase D-like domain-containing protein [Phenylobacterium deserti]RAK51313.1 phospholipase [Phenylobacterium deserti]
MQLVLGGVNGFYLRTIMENAGDKVERVDAAVAYATREDLLFDWCWNNEVPLRFWGRFDEGVPVAVPILKRFLERRAARYSCKLVRCFHPKVIWWRGHGAYIGSANLTPSAWYNNIEAGMFLTDEELEGSGQALELNRLFAKIDQESSPLTKELYELLERRSLELQRRRQAQKDADDAFVATDLVKKFTGSAFISSATAGSQARDEFLQEWISTLQTIRNIADVVSSDEFRPHWVAPDAPRGAQADQFLHAHYYKRTFDKRKAAYERYFEENKSSPDKALAEAAQWWKVLADVKDEENTLNLVAPMLRETFSEASLATMTEDAFADALWHVHASREYARRVKNAKVGLPDGPIYPMETKSDALARRIWRDSTSKGIPVTETLAFVLYGGAPEEVPHRMWDALNDSRRKVELLGVSSLGEIIGWALPDLYPPRNGRTSKSLRSLGYDVHVHV